MEEKAHVSTPVRSHEALRVGTEFHKELPPQQMSDVGVPLLRGSVLTFLPGGFVTQCFGTRVPPSTTLAEQRLCRPCADKHWRLSNMSTFGTMSVLSASCIVFGARLVRC